MMCLSVYWTKRDIRFIQFSKSLIGPTLAFVVALKGGKKGRERGGEKREGGTGDWERKGKETPVARTPHSAFRPHIKEACYQSISCHFFV